MKGHWTESLVFLQLIKVMPPPAYTWLPQVRNGTGHVRTRVRTADAFGISTWPSRGLYFIGVEIKVSRADWRRELADPAKAAEMEKYCRYWYVAAPRGVVPVAEVPETWGAIEVTSTSAEIVKTAAKRDVVPPDMLLVCSVLRACEQCMLPRESVTAEVNARVDLAIEGAKKSVQYELDALQECVRMFEKASGLELPAWPGECSELGALVKLLRATNVKSPEALIRQLRGSAEWITCECDKALAALNSAAEIGEEHGR